MVPLVVGLGGLLSGIIVFRLAPEAEGHGTDAAISAFHHGARRIRTVLVSIMRGDRLIVPRGDVAIQANDRIAVFSSTAARASLDRLLGGPGTVDEPAERPTG